MLKEKICGCFRANLHPQQSEDDPEDLDLHSGSLASINNEENLHDLKFQEDRLSNFCDRILIQILSFLPIKDAVQTSLLSKRWINLWKYVTDLRVDDKSFFYPEEDIFRYDLRKFEHFVHNLISKFPLLENLQSLSFSCQYSLNSRFLHSLISATLENDVPKVDISYFVKGFIFPTSLFECSNLQELNLHMNGSIFHINNLIHHSSLRILRISGIVFANSPVVLFDFPSVEVFELESCMWSDIVQEVRIIVPLAESFTLKNCGREDEGCYCCRVEILGLSVKKLSLVSCDLVQFYPPLNSYSVKDASIGLEIKSSDDKWELWDEMYNKACRIVEALDGVQYLKLETNIELVLQYGGNFAASLPTFEKLVRLEIATSEIEFASVLTILNKAPFLENLICETSINSHKDRWTSEVAPLSYLKRVILKAFKGGKGDIHLAKYILKNATMLEKMSISMIPRLCDSKNSTERVEEQLLKSTQGSSQVAIEFLRHQVTRKEPDLQFSTHRFFNMI